LVDNQYIKCLWRWTI